MPPPTSSLGPDADMFSPKVVITMTGSLIGFFATIIALYIVARKTCCAGHARAAREHVHASSRAGVSIAAINQSRCLHCIHEKHHAEGAVDLYGRSSSSMFLSAPPSSGALVSLRPPTPVYVPIRAAHVPIVAFSRGRQ
ncbi:hypothetical protein OH76DRAFT_634248 [Lentinus brumalis]|uniref:Uncharacterized protein n=1 Tax=Lentinus brumalis TaxID=2498619 RepID=A0A371D8M0_9APHY|nr:hypothetical protein OH76DRAFT_634248 [Polyporus brumalis]